MPQIDASEAIRALGIHRPVTFKDTDLNGGPIGLLLGDHIIRGQAFPPAVVRIDWRAIRYLETMPLTELDVEGPGSTGGANDSPEEIIAHELIHVRQMQDAGLVTVDDVIEAYDAMTPADGSERAHPWEAEARELAPRYASMVKVTR